MNIDFLSFMKGFYENQGIQFLLFSHPYENLEQSDYSFRRQMFPDYHYDQTMEVFRKHLKPGVLYQLEDEFRIFYIVYYVPEHQRHLFEADIVCIGPVLFQPITVSMFQSVMLDHNISPEYEAEVSEFLNHIPLPGPFDNWAATATYLFSTLIGEPIDSITLLRHDLEQHHASFANYDLSGQPNVALQTIEQRYQTETEILNAVMLGNIEAASAAYIRFRQYKLTPRTADPARNFKNMLIILNTLLRKAVQKGGVHPLHMPLYHKEKYRYNL